ncbi:MAG: lipase class 3 [Anaerosporomusa subterranea]|jgi:hypothetical protein|nr:lipase class 3 [Anaerosporomusa subterranea]
MKRFLLLLLCSFMLYAPTTGHTEAKSEYETAYKLYIAAGASAAAYNDRTGALASRYLQQDGWKINHYVQDQGHPGPRFLIANKEGADGKDIYIVAIAGTETTEDIKQNLKVEKVYFAGAAPEEFVANAAKKDVPDTQPKVHRGFNELWQAGPTAKLRKVSDVSLISLPDLLANNKDYTLYLTGHSLGGAAATLAGAGLISMGVNPEQIEVITFGAPAVGNDAFSSQYEPVLNLTRVVIDGDPVTGVLQTIAGGYTQFGREIKWTIPPTLDEPHKLVGYVDLAIKNYYDKRQQAINAGLELPIEKIKPVDGVYIAALNNNLSGTPEKDFWYMREALWDEYRKKLPEYVIESEDNGGSWREKALAAGSRWAIVPEVSSMTLKQEKNIYHVNLTQTVYEVASGAVVDVAIYSAATYNLTPLEAFIHSLREMTSEQVIWLKK